MSLAQWIAIGCCFAVFFWIKWGEAWANKKIVAAEWSQEKVVSAGTKLAVVMVAMIGYSVIVLFYSVWFDMGFGEWLGAIDWETFCTKLGLTLVVFLAVSLGGGIKLIRFVSEDIIGTVSDRTATILTYWWFAVVLSVLYVSAVLVYHIWS